MDEIFMLLGENGIEVVDGDGDMATREAEETAGADEDARTEAERRDPALFAADRTSDPVRMYLREMGMVPLLTREKEVVLSRRIEKGRRMMLRVVSRCEPVAEHGVERGRLLRKGEESGPNGFLIGDDEEEQDVAVRRRSLVNAVPAIEAQLKETRKLEVHLTKVRAGGRAYRKALSNLARARVRL